MIWVVVAVLLVWLVLLATGDSDDAPLTLDPAPRPDPADLLSDPTLLLREPGILGLAVQLQAEQVVDECMAAAGFAYDGVPGIERVSHLDLLAATGYGIGQGLTLETELADLAYLEQFSREALDDYETALYGEPLRRLADGVMPGGCAGAGLEAALNAISVIESLQPSLSKLYSAGRSDERWQAAAESWFGCMAEQVSGLSPLFALDSPLSVLPSTPGDPDEFIASLLAILDGPLGDALAAIAGPVSDADAACREAHIAAAFGTAVDDLASALVEGNQDRLQNLLGGLDG